MALLIDEEQEHLILQIEGGQGSSDLQNEIRHPFRRGAALFEGIEGLRGEESITSRCRREGELAFLPTDVPHPAQGGHVLEAEILCSARVRRGILRPAPVRKPATN